jgi:hypothetical protein
MRSPRAPLLFLALLAACTPAAPVQYRVPDLRILAINATTTAGGAATLGTADAYLSTDAEPSADTVTLTALVANPLARQSPTVRWFACAPPLDTSPCNPEQLRDLDAFPTAPGVFELPALGTGETVSFAPASLPTVVKDGILGVMKGTLATALVRRTTECVLYVELPVIAIVRSGGIAEAALKRIRLLPPASLLTLYPTVTDHYVPNHNPVIAEIRVNPTDVDACTGGTLVSAIVGPLPAGKNTICATATTTPTIDVSYNQCTDVPIFSVSSIPETPEWQWYVSAGEISGTNFDGNAEGKKIELTPSPGPFTLWVIVRDGNGGTDWAYRDLSSP